MEIIISEKTLKQKITTISNQKLFLVSLALIIINSILVKILATRTGVHNLDATYGQANNPAVIISAIVGIIISLPVMCLFLAFITAIFINKNQPYKKRYLRGYLLTLFIINVIVLIRFAYNILLG
jgi:uncharacterized protein YqgC (DUF456 family)